MLNKVDVLLPNSSQYGVLHYFARQLHEAFLRLKYRSRLLSKEQYQQSLFSDPPDFTIGFNGAPIAEDGEFLCDKALIPHIACLVDPPYRFLSLQTSPYILITCDDQYCVNAFKTEQQPNYFFFPHGIDPHTVDNFSINNKYDVVFLGSYIDDRHRPQRWLQLFPKIVCQAMNDAAEQVFAGEPVHFMQAFLKQINHAFSVQGSQPFILSAVLKELELYIKGVERNRLIRAIKSARVDIFGASVEKEGWKEAFGDQPNIVIHNEVPFAEALSIMSQAKIVLNSGLKSIEGAHERIFNGMAKGAAVVTSSNTFLLEHFKNEESILFYQPEKLEEIETKIGHYLKSESERQAVAKKGQQLVLEHHTWDKRLEILLPQVLPLIQRLR